MRDIIINMKKALIKLKISLPLIYSYFENLLKTNLISSKILIKRPSLDNVGKIIASRIAGILPHIDTKQIKQLIEKYSSFLEILSNFSHQSQREYTFLKKKNLFKRVLIANRGEIALRIIRACRELGIEVIALYSAQEKNSLSVKFANKSYCIGAVKNYLNIKKIVKIAKKLGVTAIHPGYGFLAENPSFAKLCETKKIKFIGPTSKMIALLGNKVMAKRLMMANGIPVIEGLKSINSLANAKKLARNIGYPVIIKASEGGGGKGMRIVKSEDEMHQAYEGARLESKSSFGEESLYIEKYVEEPRHIEFQILADRHGNVIHLGERECSIQRRHQKLVEEAPSTALSPELRNAIGDAAVKAIKAIKYEGAGTVEFLLDKNNNFYFIEMNTRIQVEHGVTEMITGVDLVKEQIKLASGAKLAHEQDDVKINGWAIECRINAEDPLNNFTPSPGIITNYLPPGGPGIRISSGCHSGFKIEPSFDSLIALLICYGSSRNEALARMNRALDEYVIEGVKTTIPFHKSVLNHKEFIKGDITTEFIEKYQILEHIKEIKDNKMDAVNKKILIVTAVSKYLAKRQIPSYKQDIKISPWVTAARQDSMQEGSLEE